MSTFVVLLVQAWTAENHATKVAPADRKLWPPLASKKRSERLLFGPDATLGSRIPTSRTRRVLLIVTYRREAGPQKPRLLTNGWLN
jgi:hypothetical protein